MRIVITIGENEYEYTCPAEYPDADQCMFAIESIIRKLGYPEKEIEEYVLGWAEEINFNRDGKS